MNTFLIIDDEPLVLNQVTQILKASFKVCRILTANNGLDGIRLARDHNPSVIILDISMPEMDGFDTCSRLKADSATSFIPVIMITGVKTDTESRNKALAVGADDYIYKPFSTEDLVFHIKVFLRIRRTEDALRQRNEQFETELSKRSSELWESEKKFRELAELLPDVIFETDRELNILYLNKAGLKLFGYADEDIKSGVSLREMVIFNARQGEQHIAQALQGATIPAYEYLARTKNGNKFVARINFAPAMNNDEVCGLRGALIDITQFKQIERQLIDSRESFRALFNNMFDAFVVCELLSDADNKPFDCRFIEVNPAFNELTGRENQEIIGHTFLELFPDAEKGWIEKFGQVGTTGATSKFEGYFGELGRHLQVSAFSPGPNMVAMILLDVTEKKIAEERGIELQRETARSKHLELLASLSGAVAHDLNNVFGPLLCYPDMILLDTPEDAPFREHLIEIKQSTKRAVAIIEDLLSLGKSGAFRQTPLCLAQAFNSYLNSPEHEKIMSTHPSLRVKTRIDQDQDNLRINGNAQRLTRVFENLFQQICPLAEEGSELSVSLCVQHIETTVKGCLEMIPHGKYVVLEIRAHGPGLDNDSVQEMFDPFGSGPSGSTKRSLAMALIHSVIHDHSGYLRMKSSRENGAVFALYFLPAGEPEKDAATDKEFTDLRGTERILVVDDMRNQRLMAQKMLSSLGYQVVTAINGRDAVRIIEKELASGKTNEHVFDLVLLDMMMEDDFDGLDTFRKILELTPKQKCVIVSGFAKSERVKQADVLGIKGFVRKPYTYEGIGKVVRRVIDSEK